MAICLPPSFPVLGPEHAPRFSFPALFITSAGGQCQGAIVRGPLGTGRADKGGRQAALQGGAGRDRRRLGRRGRDGEDAAAGPVGGDRRRAYYPVASSLVIQFSWSALFHQRVPELGPGTPRTVVRPAQATPRPPKGQTPPEESRRSSCLRVFGPRPGWSVCAPPRGTSANPTASPPIRQPPPGRSDRSPRREDIHGAPSRYPQDVVGLSTPCIYT